MTDTDESVQEEDVMQTSEDDTDKDSNQRSGLSNSDKEGEHKSEEGNGKEKGNEHVSVHHSKALSQKRRKQALSAIERAKRKDPSLQRRRKKLQGNSGKMFSEGWIEFADKKVAKRVAQMLNGNPMGGKKRSAYHYDLWCLKYLPKFKWDNLTEEIAYQNAVREQKMANEISAAKRERDFYLSRVDRAKAESAKDERRKRKAEKVEGATEASASLPTKKIMRTFGQKSAKSRGMENHDDATVLPASVLSLLAGKSS